MGGERSPALVERLRPAPESRAAYEVGVQLLSVLLVAIFSHVVVDVPGSPVPVTGQSFAVILVGGLLGSWRGGLALVAYLVLGAAGLPLFAHGESGFGHLTGATGGYLLAFPVGAALAGWLVERGWDRRFLLALTACFLATVVLLLLGWGRLSFLLGPAEAFSAGVAPFLLGGLLKAVLAAGILRAVAGVKR